MLSRLVSSMKKYTTDEFIVLANAKHDNRYSYSKTEYTHSNNKILVECYLHGTFELTAKKHLEGIGCKQCGNASQAKTRIGNKAAIFVDRANKVHNNTYSYEKSIYVSSIKQVVIICSKHGEFVQTPSIHLSGHGCSMCGRDKVSESNIGRDTKLWKYTEWEEAGNTSCNFDGFKCYIIECWDETERFVKIGKTFTSLARRFPNGSVLPYEWKIVKVYEGSSNYISKLEKELQAVCKQDKYVPIKSFAGTSECYTINCLKSVGE